LLEGFEPDLPAIEKDDDGNQWQVDRKTGEAVRLADGPDTDYHPR
jgi:hypothetical protein